jgi:CheY-like chemotaxis protein
VDPTQVKTPASSSGPVILVVDDAPYMRRWLQRVLAEAGYRNVLGTPDSHEAIGLYAHWRPDLVISDLCRPHLDGVQTLHVLRAIDPRVRVLVYSALDEEHHAQRALAAGAAAFMRKPIDQAALVPIVRAMLGATGAVTA